MAICPSTQAGGGGASSGCTEGDLSTAGIKTGFYGLQWKGGSEWRVDTPAGTRDPAAMGTR